MIGLMIFGWIMLLLGVIMVLIDSVEEPGKMGTIGLECTRECEHTDCKHHIGNVTGCITRTDLKWSPACPYYTYREDLDDPEG